MTTEEKKAKIQFHVERLLAESYGAMEKQISRMVNSSAIDVDSWEPDSNHMILPKIIVTALLEAESTQYDCKGTSFEKEIKKGVKNLRYSV